MLFGSRRLGFALQAEDVYLAMLNCSYIAEQHEAMLNGRLLLVFLFVLKLACLFVHDELGFRPADLKDTRVDIQLGLVGDPINKLGILEILPHILLQQIINPLHDVQLAHLLQKRLVLTKID